MTLDTLFAAFDPVSAHGVNARARVTYPLYLRNENNRRSEKLVVAVKQYARNRP